MIEERFAGFGGTALGVRATPISGITTLSIDGLRLLQAATATADRLGLLFLTIDGDAFEVRFRMTDETLESSDLRGRHKRRDRQAAGLPR